MTDEEKAETIEEFFGKIDIVSNPFDPKKDYIKELTGDEKWEEKGKIYPYLRGLKRLAHEHRGGIRMIRSVPVKVPSVNTTGAKGENPDCMAACTIAYHFNDGTVFEGSADASYKAHKAPFNLHLLATAESKAEARAIRRAFNISQCAKEEMGGASDDEAKDNEPINDTQLEGIKRNARRKKLSQKDVLTLIKREDLGDIKKLTYADAIKALKAVNRYKPKPEEAPKEEAKQEETPQEETADAPAS
jgi:hypothetical protein